MATTQQSGSTAASAPAPTCLLPIDTRRLWASGPPAQNPAITGGHLPVEVHARVKHHFARCPFSQD
ncbi:MAG: hypothetical protein ACR2PL_15480 [Dehalococcoidia bacterium]